MFEAAGAGACLISDAWDGIEQFLEPGREVLLGRTADDVLGYIRDLAEEERVALGARARERILAEHTAAHRAEELEGYVLELMARQTST